jgi:hypothetical protein
MYNQRRSNTLPLCLKKCGISAHRDRLLKLRTTHRVFDASPNPKHGSSHRSFAHPSPRSAKPNGVRCVRHKALILLGWFPATSTSNLPYEPSPNTGHSPAKHCDSRPKSTGRYERPRPPGPPGSAPRRDGRVHLPLKLFRPRASPTSISPAQRSLSERHSLSPLQRTFQSASLARARQAAVTSVCRPNFSTHLSATTLGSDSPRMSYTYVYLPVIFRPSTRKKSALRSTIGKVAFPYGICALILLPSLYWIARDKAVWLWDQAWYGEVSVDLWYQLIHHPVLWLGAMREAFGIKAPGIAWVGEFFVPLGQAFGSIEFGLLLSVLAAQFATLVLMYRIGRELGSGSRSSALFAVLFVAAAPLFAAMSHQYLVESLQTLAVTYIFWIAVAAPGLSRLRVLAHLLLASSLALLAKSTSPLYCIFPGLVAGFWVVRAKCWVKDRSEGLRSLGILTIGIVTAAAATAWYSRNLTTVAEFMRNASSGATSLYYGHVGTLGAKLMFWLRALRAGFFVPFAPIAIGLLALAGLVLAWKRGVAMGLRRSHFVVAAALAEVLLVLAVFSFQVSEESRYLLPMVPALAICLVWVLSLGGATMLRAAACLMAVQLIVIHSQALGLTNINWSVSSWLVPYQRAGADSAELRELIRLTSGPGTEFRYNVVGVQFPWLNENALSFYAAQGRLLTGRRNYFTSLGYAETDADRAWNRMEQIKTLYFVGAEADRQPTPPDFLNQVSVPILRRVIADRNYTRVPFPSHFGILLFRRGDAPVR